MRVALKFLAASIVGTVSVICLFTWVFLEQQRAGEESQLREKMDRLGHLFTDINREPIWNIDRDLVTRNARSFLQDADIVGVRLADETGEIQIDFQDNPLPREGHLLPLNLRIKRRGQYLAEGTLTFTTARIDQHLWNFQQYMIGLGAFLVTALILVNLLIARVISRPVHRLIATVKKAEAGDYSARTKVEGADEFCDLASSFNGMLASIQQRDQLLQARNEEVAATNRELEREVDRREKMQEDLRQAQKMEAVGRLAGGIAHDFNNLLTSILGFSDLVKHQLPKDSPLCDEMNQVIRAGERASELTSQLLTFAHKRKMELVPIDPNWVIANMHKLIQRTIGEHIEIELERDKKMGNILADPNAFSQIIMNLAVNGADAMPGGGTLTFSSHRKSALAVDEENSEGRDWAVIEVLDTGCGIRAEILEHIFDPFYTTKGVGKGTGLGLSNVYSLVHQFHGTISVKSEENRGTSFTMRFPLTDQKGEPASTKEAVGDYHGKEKLLLVEDEEAVRELCVNVLESLGYRVIEAQDGYDGLEKLRKHHQHLDLIVADVVMPQLGGQEMIEQAEEENICLPVLYVSGFSEERPVVHQAIRNGHFLQKPFTPSDLASKVRQILDEAPSPLSR